jgi:hypothetical protein
MGRTGSERLRLEGGAVTGVGDEALWRSISIERITARAEHPDRQIQLNIEFGHVDLSLGGDPLGDRWFARQLTRRVARAPHIHGFGSGGSTMRVNVHRDQIEQSVRAIRATVDEFNEAYPSLLEERRSEIERREVENGATHNVLAAAQRLIDQVLDE